MGYLVYRPSPVVSCNDSCAAVYGGDARHALHCGDVPTQPTRPAQSKTERKKALSSGASCMALPPVPLSISASIASTLSRLSATVGCARRDRTGEILRRQKRQRTPRREPHLLGGGVLLGLGLVAAKQLADFGEALGPEGLGDLALPRRLRVRLPQRGGVTSLPLLYHTLTCI